jgi:hypothetical protein
MKNGRIDWEKDDKMKIILDYIKRKEENKRKRGKDTKNMAKSDLNQTDDP